ncbi:MAG: 2-amino-4-hydroxy-6-hydroxymethyldihydropteridine diphosphokinase [Flavisolibacter sp.]
MAERSLNRAWLLTGGNMGNRGKFLQKAREALELSCGKILKASSLYETAAWGRQDQPAFLNQALLLETQLSAEQLLKRILSIEKELGRERDQKYGPRTLDIDILLFNEEIINNSKLVVPHPQLPLRRFALMPLAEIAADERHPVLEKTIAELLEQCPDPLDVQKLK